MKQPVLPHHHRTKHLVIRLWQPDDAIRLAAAIAESRDHLTPWVPWAGQPGSAADMRDLIEHWNIEWHRGGDAVYGMFAGDEVVGGCGLHHRGGPGVLDIGYWVHVAHTGRGYATESASALTSAASSREAIHSVRIEHDTANHRSAAVPRRLGYCLSSIKTRTAECPGEVGILQTWVMSSIRWRERHDELEGST